MKIFSPLKKASSSFYFSTPSPSVSNKVYAFKVKSSIHYFPEILATPSSESFSETPSFNAKSFPKKNLDLDFVFSHSRTKYLSFKKALSSKRIITPARPEE